MWQSLQGSGPRLSCLMAKEPGHDLASAFLLPTPDFPALLPAAPPQNRPEGGSYSKQVKWWG